MSESGSGERDRRVAEFALALASLVALGLLAAVFAGGGAALVTEADDEEPKAAVLAADADGVGLVGGGSLGAADRNPVGVGVANETNPFRTRSGEVQFLVTGERPDYWRVDAYDTYENGTWVRTGDYESYEGRLDPTGRVSTEQNHTVTLEREAAALPTAWQPATVTPANASTVAVSAETGLQTPMRTAAGREYTVSTYRYDPDARRLATSRAMYPSSIERRYGEPPNGTSERVRTLGETIAEDAVTPVQTACRIDTWIAENTEYDHEITHEPGTDPVEQFLFEMETGNAEYAASSMVVLLRTQGVPARYVTGYSPGAPVAEAPDTVGVRAVNAHAWVEVYVSGHGWIPFDPTPADARRAVETAALDDGIEPIDGSLPADCSLDIDVAPIPESGVENVSVPADDAEQPESDATDSDDGTGTAAEDEALNVTLGGANVTVTPDREPLIIGGEASVVIRSDGEPVSNGSVAINGEAVGTTDATGRLTFRVPAGLSAGQVPLTVQTETIDGGQLVAVAEFELTAASSRVLALPGETVAVRASAGEEPIEGVALTAGDEEVATTDVNGTADVPLSAARETTLEASYAGSQSTVTIENRLAGVVLRVIGVVAILGGVAVVLNREYAVFSTAQRGAKALGEGVRRAAFRAANGLRRIPAVVSRARRRGLRATLAEIVRWPARLLQRVRARLPASLLGYVLVLALQVYRSLTGARRTETDGPTSETALDEGISGKVSDTAADAAWTSITQIWGAFVRLVLHRVMPTYTPGEVARAAIAKGFPRGPVVRLTNAFRAAAYGPKRSEALTEEATTAMAEIEQHTSDETTADETGREGSDR